uniref:26S proteasome complex subunit SEM1 n=1 Tax=Cyanistes caeruleus TaxID=156563 RepID=A0A8C0VF87_CYACU
MEEKEQSGFLSLDWTGLDEDEDAHVWEDNWDDDNSQTAVFMFLISLEGKCCSPPL